VLVARPAIDSNVSLREVERRIDRVFAGRGGQYSVTLLGRSRADGMWEGRIRFEPLSGGGAALITPVESTQPSERLLIHWTEGLGDAFYEGAFERAVASLEPIVPVTAVASAPESTRVDLSQVEVRVLDSLRSNGAPTLNRQYIFERMRGFSNSDVERALEDLERRRKIVRFTDRGFVWIALSRLGTEQPPKRGRTREDRTPELIFEHPHPIGSYEAVVLGVQRDDGTWAGWLQFRDVKTNERLRTEQETSQPNLDALEYWATGLEDVYFEGALERATAASAGTNSL